MSDKERPQPSTLTPGEGTRDNEISDVKWRQIFAKQNDNIKALIEALKLPPKNASVVLPEFDEQTCDTRLWTATADLCFGENPPSGGQLVLVLSKALKGMASSWLSQISYPHMTWSEFKVLFNARYISNETVPASLINLSNDKPKDDESLVAYANRLVTSLTNRWQNHSIEEIAVSTVLAHLANLDSRLQRIAFTNKIITRQRLLQELQAYSNMKQRSDFRRDRRLLPSQSTALQCLICGNLGHSETDCPNNVENNLTQTSTGQSSGKGVSSSSINSKIEPPPLPRFWTRSCHQGMNANASSQPYLSISRQNTNISLAPRRSFLETSLRCPHCGQFGHELNECKTNPFVYKIKPNPISQATEKPEESSASSAKCIKCGKTGHDKSQCPERDENGPWKGTQDQRVIEYVVQPIDNYYAPHISKLRSSQSPIAISLQRCPKWTSLSGLIFSGYWTHQSRGTLCNTGNTARLDFDTGEQPFLYGGPLVGKYNCDQMHFHWSVDDFTGSEHRLNGRGYAAEVHLVHHNSKYESQQAEQPDGLGVVALFLNVVDKPNPLFDELVEGLKQVKVVNQRASMSPGALVWLNRDDLHKGNYVTYKGSLTSAPYNECVTWIIFEKPVHIGNEQIRSLRQLQGFDSNLITRNVRPTQKHPRGHSVIYVNQTETPVTNRLSVGSLRLR